MPGPCLVKLWKFGQFVTIWIPWYEMFRCKKRLNIPLPARDNLVKLIDFFFIDSIHYHDSLKSMYLLRFTYFPFFSPVLIINTFPLFTFLNFTILSFTFPLSSYHYHLQLYLFKCSKSEHFNYIFLDFWCFHPTEDLLHLCQWVSSASVLVKTSWIGLL